MRRSRRIWVSTRPATAAVMRGVMPRPALTIARKAASIESAPACCLISAGRAVGDDPAVAHQQQPVAPLGLVHDVAGDEHRGPVVGEVVEEGPEVLAQDRVETDRGLIEHQQVRAAEEGDGEAGPAALTAAELPDHLVVVAAQVDRLDDAVHLVLVDAEDAGEEAEVLGDREVVVHAGRLGDVADPVPQRPAAGLLAEDADRPGCRLLDADQAAHQRGLAAARWGRAGR